jgi:hypothetical protein
MGIEIERNNSTEWSYERLEELANDVLRKVPRDQWATFLNAAETVVDKQNRRELADAVDAQIAGAFSEYEAERQKDRKERS